jgi:hypothetical protein
MLVSDIYKTLCRISNYNQTFILLLSHGSIELGQDKAQAIIDEITKAYERVGQSGKIYFFI